MRGGEHGVALSRSDSPRFVEQSAGLFQSLRNSLGEHHPVFCQR